MSKATLLSDLYLRSVQEYTQSPDKWKGLLSFAARFYKRSFDNAVLIYAQRPNASQLATFDEWHDKRINRRINGGAKGIAVIDMSNPKASLKYLFDFMDTNGDMQSFKRVLSYLWELEEQYHSSLLIKLHEKYDTPTSSIEDCLYKLVQQQAESVLPQYMEGFEVHDESSILFDAPINAVKAEFSELVTDSVAYTVFQKCGLSTEVINEEAFQNIGHFNNLELFMALGSCTVSLARPILKEIHQEIQQIKIERSQIYENRTINESKLQEGQGRDALSRDANFGERENGQDAGWEVREPMENLYAGELPTPPVRTGSTGRNQHDDFTGRRGSRTAQGTNDTGAINSPADAGNRGYNGESRTHEYDNFNSRGNRDKRTGAESKVNPSNTVTEPPTDKKPSAGGFFSVPPSAEPKTVPPINTAAEPETSPPTHTAIEPKTDPPIYTAAEPETSPPTHTAIEPKTDPPIYTAAEPETSPPTHTAFEPKTDPPTYTATEPETSPPTHTAFEPKTDPPTYTATEPETNPPIYTAAEPVQALDDEEISDIIDMVLCAGDIRPDTREWVAEIYKFFTDGHKQSHKVNILKAFYGKLDMDYITKNKDYLYILGDSEGLTFNAEGQQFSESYSNLAKRIDRLILTGAYPLSSADIIIDDFSIPDEIEEMQGLVHDKDTDINVNSIAPAIQGKQEIIDMIFRKSGSLAGSKERIYKAFTTSLSKKEQVAALKKEHGIGGSQRGFENGGYERIEYNSSGFTIDYQYEGIVVNERFSWNKVADRISELIMQDQYLTIEEKAELEAIGNYIYPPEILQGTDRQINLFDMTMPLQDSYEDSTSDNNDGVIDENLDEPPLLFNQANEHHDLVQIEDSHNHAGNKPFNYHYSIDHDLYIGGPKTKCRNNIEAIRLLKELQAQGRLATAEEQITLARFVGWGGLANALTPDKPDWKKEYEEIKSILTDEEFQEAQKSTLTSYYTEQSIISHIYNALSRMGFSGGNILDPALGTGNFFSVLPENMKNSKLYGCEIDPISGHIAKHLYPGADIQVSGFEKTDYSDHFFDVVVGNIPFNSIKIDDSRYNKHNFPIHDYFVAKSLDKVRPGGILALITSQYTMDKANSSMRRYVAGKAELIGAVRLPNNAFKKIAGTEVTTDILFLKKREREVAPDEHNCNWLLVEQNQNGVPMNSYFISHPEMVLGEMVFDESKFGNEKTTACHPIAGDDLNERLERAINYLDGEYTEAVSEYENEKEVLNDSIPADSNVRNFSYTVVNDELYFRENSRMYKQDITGRKAERIRGMIEVTEAIRSLIDFQNDNHSPMNELPTVEYEKQLQEHIGHLNRVYDSFIKKQGYLNSNANVMAYSRDANAPLLRSVEREKKDQKNEWEKTTIFYKATIKPKVMPKTVFSADEALMVSLNVKGRIDLEYMSLLYQLPEHRKATPDEIIEELGDKIYQDPAGYNGDSYTGWKTADEYLSGYVKDKLEEAIWKAEEEPERFTRNVEALKLVQPQPLTPQDISFSLGTTWIPTEIYQQFMYETFRTSYINQTGYSAITIEFSSYSGAYHITQKSAEKGSVIVNQSYGTNRMNAYEILETTLNLRPVEVKDRVEYVDPATGGIKVKYVLNKTETILAREKQAEIKVAFESWLFAEPERGANLTKRYNDLFNNIRLREYNGDNLLMPDMAEGITLRKHQLDVIAHGLYGEGNLLMAHEVGAGKTYAGIGLGYEMKRIGIIHKPLYAVPNHLVGEWARHYLIMYPNANILVAEKRDFRRENRRRFVGRIATGEYDAIIMGHSSFELIGMSRERQLAAMKTEIAAIKEEIKVQKVHAGKDWSLKQMEIFQANLQYRYDRLFNAEKKDDVINFEELGVDALFIDEAHAYKNNFSYTKMRNVAGVSGVSSQRAMDMHQKCQYINEISAGKGVVYLTGTPISNSMSELYVLQKTLQPKALEKLGILMFDAWASTFGIVESSLEIKPEGNGYQMKNRFARFHNLPELMSLFHMIADIRTADMLDLPVPRLKTGEVQVIKTKITPEQKRIVMELGERAELIRNGVVDSSMDNFLKLTLEARLLSIDPRAIDPLLPDDPNTKLNICAEKVAEFYHETADNRLTQLIFCDQSTPKGDGSFNFYDATKDILIGQGVAPEDIAFIHDAKTDVQREELFEKVRNGQIRILMGSTMKMGTGMNVRASVRIA